MKFTKKCEKCGCETKVEASQKVCEKCGGNLLRQFNGAKISLGQIVEDEFVKKDREMLLAASPQGKDRSCF